MQETIRDTSYIVVLPTCTIYIDNDKKYHMFTALDTLFSFHFGNPKVLTREVMDRSIHSSWELIHRDGNDEKRGVLGAPGRTIFARRSYREIAGPFVANLLMDSYTITRKRGWLFHPDISVFVAPIYSESNGHSDREFWNVPIFTSVPGRFFTTCITYIRYDATADAHAVVRQWSLGKGIESVIHAHVYRQSYDIMRNRIILTTVDIYICMYI